jgi:hypothetical protein
MASSVYLSSIKPEMKVHGKFRAVAASFVWRGVGHSFRLLLRLAQSIKITIKTGNQRQEPVLPDSGSLTLTITNGGWTRKIWHKPASSGKGRPQSRREIQMAIFARQDTLWGS